MLEKCVTLRYLLFKSFEEETKMHKRHNRELKVFVLYL